MTWPALTLWLLILGVTLLRRDLLVYLFTATMVFGSLTMLPPGGLNLTAQTVCSLLLVATTLIQRRNLEKALAMALDLRRLGFLFLFLLYAVFTAMFLSRLFAWMVWVVPLNNSAAGLQPMHPTSSNFTQAVYMTLSVGIAFVFALKGQNPEFRARYLRAILLAGALLVVSGIVDLVLTEAGRASLLAPFHNAHYALLTDVKEAGHLRVVGVMPEASAFGSACVSVLSLLVFCFDDFEARLRRFIVPATILGLVAMIYLSTSSTGFVGFIVIATLYVARVGARTLVHGRLRRSSALILMGVIVGLGLGYAYAVTSAPHLIASVDRLVNKVLFEKTQSYSFIQRLAWTRAGFDAFLRTHGIGVGVGSVRTSDWIVNLLASTGVLGTLLFAAAVAVAIAGLRHQRDAELRRFGTGLVFAAIPIGTMMLTSGTTPDPGAFNLAILGFLVALSRSEQTHPVRQGPTAVPFAASMGR